MREPRAANTACPNCDTPAEGRFCPSCGQRQGPLLLPLRTIAAEALSEYISLDNRLLITLRHLVARPGFLTSEYVGGHRARYVPPFRLYLTVSVVYFVAVAWSSTGLVLGAASGENVETITAILAFLPKLMLVMLPGFAAVLQLLYWRTGRHYVEHLIFALHFQSFAYAAYTLDALVNPIAARAALAGEWTPMAVAAAVFSVVVQLGTLVYLYLALHRVYGESHRLTAVKMLGAVAGYYALLAAVGIGAVASVDPQALAE